MNEHERTTNENGIENYNFRKSEIKLMPLSKCYLLFEVREIKTVENVLARKDALIAKLRCFCQALNYRNEEIFYIYIYICLNKYGFWLIKPQTPFQPYHIGEKNKSAQKIK